MSIEETSRNHEAPDADKPSHRARCRASNGLCQRFIPRYKIQRNSAKSPPLTLAIFPKLEPTIRASPSKILHEIIDKINNPTLTKNGDHVKVYDPRTPSRLHPHSGTQQARVMLPLS